MSARRAGGKRRPRSDALENRAAIIATAARSVRPGSALDMQAVAASVGVSRSTLYRHFPTRASLEDALCEDGLQAVRATIDRVLRDERPPLAVLRELVDELVALGAKRRLDVLGAVPLTDGADEAIAALLPALERLRRVAEVSPRPPQEWLESAARHFVSACLETGCAAQEGPHAAAETLFRSLTEPLDQGLVFLDPDGALICANPSAARALDPVEPVAVGERLAEPHVDLLYEDGSASPVASYPLATAVRTGEPHSGVRGHGARPDARWLSVHALPLRSPRDGSIYAVLGILSDVTAVKEWQLERLRPPGELGGSGPVPLDIARVLDEIPPHLFPEQFVSEARRVSGAPVALYVLDIDGTHLLRLAGPEEFPARLDAPLALGPELAEDGMPDLIARVETDLPGVTVAPMWLRGRAIGLLLALRAQEHVLGELARHGAAAMELAGGYTDVIDAARRRKETHAAAELQQSLLPPRIARMGGGVLAGSVLPSYEVGGDWFDYVENRDGAWIAIADAVGKGATAGALGAIALAARRARDVARRASKRPRSRCTRSPSRSADRSSSSRR